MVFPLSGCRVTFQSMLERLRILARRVRTAGEAIGTSAEATGSAGEKAAEAHLVSMRGFQILARNWRHKKDELDLVCRDGEILVFVEVKTRRAGSRVPGYYAVNTRKKKALNRAIRAYQARISPKPKAVRFDVVEVEWEAGRAGVVRHFENVPLFSKAFARSP